MISRLNCIYSVHEVQRKTPSIRMAFFLFIIRVGIRTDLNSTVRWTVDCRRLDDGNTLIESNPSPVLRRCLCPSIRTGFFFCHPGQDMLYSKKKGMTTMYENHLWNRAKTLEIQTGPEIVGGFSLGFDERIPEEIREELIRFVYWVEDHFSLPVTLWVDFKYNHYLIDRNGKRVGYRFWWAEWNNYPVMEQEADIPVIELPVRTEHSGMKEILGSFAEAISLYDVWLSGGDPGTYLPDREERDAVLDAYFRDQA